MRNDERILNVISNFMVKFFLLYQLINLVTIFCQSICLSVTRLFFYSWYEKKQSSSFSKFVHWNMNLLAWIVNYRKIIWILVFSFWIKIFLWIFLHFNSSLFLWELVLCTVIVYLPNNHSMQCFFFVWKCTTQFKEGK